MSQPTQQRKARRNLFLNATLSGVDELRLFPTADDRQKAMNEVSTEVGGWDLALGITVITAVAVLTAFFAHVFARGLFTGLLPRALVDFIPAVASIFATLLAIRAMQRWGFRRGLRQKLLTCGVAVCLKCGYDLRGLPSGTKTCPECGKVFSETASLLLVAGNEPRP